MNKKSNYLELENQASKIREILIQTVSNTGGHLAPNLGVVELTLAIHKVFNSPVDKIVFDVGHQSYVHKILTGREENFHTLRQFNGIGPFADPSESIHDAFISGHAGTGLSAATGIAKANPNSKVIAVIGDASICNGHSLEALNNMASESKNIIVILNDNEMSIGKNVGALSNFISKAMTTGTYKSIKRDIKDVLKMGDFGKRVNFTLERAENSVKQFFSPLSISEMLGFKYYGVVDGHDFEDLITNLSRAKSDEGPAFIHVKTQKGKGYQFAEEDAEKFHGVSPFDLETGQTGKNKPSYSSVFGKKIVELGEKDENIHVISSAMVKGVSLGDFFEKYPDRSRDVGIAEGHGVTYAAGLAISGKKPYFALYSTFIQRGFSQLIHDVFIQKLSVRFIIDRAGIVGEDGKTHNGLYDIAMFLTVPNFMVFAPTCGAELSDILEATKDISDKSIMIRYPREASFEYPAYSTFTVGKWNEIVSGENNLFIATGSMLAEILGVEEKLKEKNISGTIVSAASIFPFDSQYICENFSKYENIFVLEEAHSMNSFGSLIINYCNENRIFKKITKIAFQDPKIPHGSRDTIMREYGMRGDKLVERIEKEVINGKYQ